jgi:hypothetical protein
VLQSGTADAPITECPDCKRPEARVEALEPRLDALEAENARLRRDSSNLHKPPSGDVAKPKRSRSRSRQERRIGGRLGRPRRERPRFRPDQIDEKHLYPVTMPRLSGGEFQPGRAPVRIIH